MHAPPPSRSRSRSRYNIIYAITKLEPEKKDHVLLALFQGHSRDWDVAKNLATMKEKISRASEAGADLIIFPELFLSGCHKLVGAEEVRKVAEERDGRSFQELSTAAQTAGVAILYGYPEVDTSSGTTVLYNSAQLIGSDGCSLANYRKTHLWLGEDERVFTPGVEFAPVVQCCGLRVGILICFDLKFPECARTLALRGAQLIAVPTAVEAQGQKFMQRTPPARAMENGVCVANVNQVDEIYCGLSSCWLPEGDCVALGGSEEELLFARFNRNISSRFGYLERRRPEIYVDICEK